MMETGARGPIGKTITFDDLEPRITIVQRPSAEQLGQTAHSDLSEFDKVMKTGAAAWASLRSRRESPEFPGQVVVRHKQDHHV